MPAFEEKEGDLQVLLEAVDASEISTIKTVVGGILRITQNPKSSVKDLKELIELDPPLSARLLKIANSAYYSLQRKVGEIEQAIILIGFDELKELALNQKICRIFAKEGIVHGYSRRKLWMHSVAVAYLAKMLFRREFGMKGDDIYAAGLLHDLGVVVEDQFLHRQFTGLLLEVREGAKSLVEAEFDALGFDHARIGGELFERWNFPGDLVVSVARHHYDFPDPGEFRPPVLALAVADHACQFRDFGFSDSRPMTGGTYRRCLEALRVEPSSINLILDDLGREMERILAGGLFADE